MFRPRRPPSCEGFRDGVIVIKMRFSRLLEDWLFRRVRSRGLHNSLGNHHACRPGDLTGRILHKSDRRIQFVVWLPLLCLLLSQQDLLGAEQNKRGREIFQQLCVKCHGRNGEGVKGKYDDALRGDWPIEKLIRYIDKNMPDDAPQKCVGPEAEAVARYIYDAFYSREARIRNHPPRVELVRLTNRQYANTVADLVKHFTGSDKAPGDDHGLNGSYRSRAGKGDG